MPDNMKIILAGAGYMGREYCKILKAMGITPLVTCRTESTAIDFERETGLKAHYGGTEKLLAKKENSFDKAIVAVNVDQLSEVTISLINNGIKKILVEKPAGMNRREIEGIVAKAKNENADVYVAYNRRFYASTKRAIDIIERDGGIDSFVFEFTEWSSVIENTPHSSEVKEEWLLGNSSHVIDLAFFLGGTPEKMSSYHSGTIAWHSRASKYSGAGVTNRGALFSYHANWDAPGRWGIEILTKKHRLYLRPMEKLSIQDINSVEIKEVPLDDELDIRFKPGLFEQVRAFLLSASDPRLLTVEEQLQHVSFYEKMDGIQRQVK